MIHDWPKNSFVIVDVVSSWVVLMIRTYSNLQRSPFQKSNVMKKDSHHSALNSTTAKWNVISRSLKNLKCIMSYERRRISRRDLQKAKMGRRYLAFAPMESQSEVKPTSRNGWKLKESASQATCSKSEAYWTRLWLRVDIFHRISASGSSLWIVGFGLSILCGGMLVWLCDAYYLSNDNITH